MLTRAIFADVITRRYYVEQAAHVDVGGRGDVLRDMSYTLGLSYLVTKTATYGQVRSLYPSLPSLSLSLFLFLSLSPSLALSLSLSHSLSLTP